MMGPLLGFPLLLVSDHSIGDCGEIPGLAVLYVQIISHNIFLTNQYSR